MSFSRNLLSIFLSSIFVLGALSSVGCSEFLEGTKREAQVIELSDTRFSCLKKMPDALKEFSAGEGKEDDIRTSFNCVSEALVYFQAKTYGSIPNAYTMEEMRLFFGKYFLKENNVTPEFAKELMKMKKALLGGSQNFITKTEITALIDLLAIVRDEAILLSPHIRILLNQALKTEAKWEQIANAISQLRGGLHRLLEKTQFAKSDYSFEDLKIAAMGLSDFIRGNEPVAPYENMGEWMPMVEAIKGVLIGRHAQLVNLYQWKEGLDSFINLYELALKYTYVIRDVNIDNEVDLRQLSQFVSEALALLKDSHQMKVSGRIPLQDVDTLIDVLLPRTPWGIKPESLKKTYRLVLVKILEPMRKGDTRGLLGLEQKHLAAIDREFNIWRMTQSFVDHVVGGEKDHLTQEKLLKSYSQFKIDFVIEKGISRDALERSAMKKSWLDLGNLLRKKPLVNFSAEGLFVVEGAPENWRYSWKSLTKLNFMRALSRLLLIGYGADSNELITLAKMNKVGLIDWYEDFSELGRDLKAFDSRLADPNASLCDVDEALRTYDLRSIKTAERSFMEANFFTFAGNGNDEMDFFETYQFVSILFSAGLKSSSELTKLSMRQSCAIGENDVFGNPYLQESCFKGVLKGNFRNLFANLPNMVKYIEKMTPQQWEEFYSFWRSSSLAAGQEKGHMDHVETSNIRTMVTILHYVESLMMAFDTNNDQQLTPSEVKAAFPRFLPFFKALRPGIWDMVLEESFAHVVFRGTIPEGSSDLGLFKWDLMTGKVPPAQRFELIRLFAKLKDQLGKAPKPSGAQGESQGPLPSNKTDFTCQ